MNTNTGIVRGTPKTTGNYTYNEEVIDSGGENDNPPPLPRTPPPSYIIDAKPQHRHHQCNSISSLHFFPSRRRHTSCLSDWSSDVCSSDLNRRATRSRPRPVLPTGRQQRLRPGEQRRAADQPDARSGESTGGPTPGLQRYCPTG